MRTVPQNASLQGDGFATLLLSRSSSGSGGNLVTVAADGTPYGSLTLDGQPMALAAQGHDVALLTTSEVITADRRLDGYRTTPTSRASVTWLSTLTAVWPSSTARQ